MIDDVRKGFGLDSHFLDGGNRYTSPSGVVAVVHPGLEATGVSTRCDINENGVL